MSPIPKGEGGLHGKKKKHPPLITPNPGQGDHPISGTSTAGQTPPTVNTEHGNRGGAGGGPPAWIIRRQQILRRAGFNVAVDGIWGAQSQAAWEKWNGRIAATTSQLQASQQKLLAQRQMSRQIHAAQARATQAIQTARSRIPIDTGSVHVDVDPRTQATINARKARRAAIVAANQQVKKTIDRLSGGDPSRLQHHKFLEQQAAAGRITADDLRFLLDHNYLDPLDAGDVRVLQQTVNAHLDKAHQIQVDGTYGQTTRDALIHLFTRAAAFHYHQSLKKVQHQLYDTHIAQAVSRKVYGHILTPGELLGVIQAGGKQADKLGILLARASLHQQQDAKLRDILHQRAVALGQATGPFDPFVTTESDRFIISAFGDGKLDQIMANAKTLPAMVKAAIPIVAAGYRAEQERYAKAASSSGHGGFWSEVGGVLSTANDALVAPVHAVEGAYYGSMAWLQSANNSSARWVQEQTGWDTSWGLVDTSGNSKLLADHGLGKGGQEFGTPTYGLSPYRAWDEGQVTLSEFGGWERFIMDIVADPLNLVGVGLISKGLRGSALFGARAVFRTSQGIDRVDHLLSPGLHGLLMDASWKASNTLLRIEDAHPGAAFATFLGDTAVARFVKANRAYQLATQTRAAARTAVNAAVREAFVTTLRPIVQSHVGQIVAEALTESSQKAGALADALDPEHLAEIHTAADTLSSVVGDQAPELVNAVLKIPTSLYSDLNRTGGALSVAGAELEGALLEHASRAILERYAILQELGRRGIRFADWETRTLDSLPVTDLRTILEARAGRARLQAVQGSIGSYRAGHAPLQWREAYLQELDAAAERINRQILPALDEMLRRKWGDRIWLTDAGTGTVRLAAEHSDEVRGALDEFFGYSVKDVYNPRNYVKVDNPNYGLLVDDADKDALIADEVARRGRSITAYAERRKRLAADTDAAQIDHWAVKQIAKAKADVVKGWKHTDAGGWFDARQTIRVPLPQARGVRIQRSAAHSQLGRLADAIADGGRPRNPGDTMFLMDAQDELIRQATPGDDGWGAFADSTSRLEALHAMAEQRMLSRAYLQQGLVLSAMRTAQSRRYRYLYHGLTAGLWTWKTLTLPLRPAFFVRNQIDNFVKALLEGLRDPRLLFNAEGKTIFEIGLVREMLGVAHFFDRMFQTDVRGILERVLNHFWMQHPSTVEKIFGVHGIPISPKVADEIRGMKSALDDVASAPSHEAISGSAVTRGVHEIERDASRKIVPEWITHFSDNAWELMAGKPETAMKKALYVSKYRQTEAAALRRGLDAEAAGVEATREAWASVSRSLFDYDSVSVLEENLKVFAPFIFFWRKNAQFWAGQVVDKPWFFLTADKANDFHQDGNSDMPQWMRRYVSMAPVAGLTDLHPALSWMSSWLRDGSNFDPLNYISIVQFYKAFKGENPGLPPDKQGWAFVAPLVDGLNSVGGLGVNPFYSEVGQRLGILNRQAWRDIFPQTTLIQAITDTSFVRDHLGVDTPNGFNVEDFLLDPIFRHITSEPSGADLTLANFNQYVNQEMAEQAHRGEAPNRAKAEAKIRGFIVFQTVVGYSIGVFPRRISKDARGIYAIIDQRAQILGDPNLTPEERRDKLQAEWFGLSEREQQAARLFKRRGYDPAAFDRYVDGMLAASAFFKIDDYTEQQEYLRQHPEVLPIVNPLVGGRLPSEQYLHDQLLLSRQDAVGQFASTFLHDIGAASDVREAAYDTLVTPSLRKFWRDHETAQETRDRHIRGAWFRYVSKVQGTYFAIPSTDYDARKQYLDRHPELLDWWRINDGASDDYKAVMQSVNGTFREVYFHFVDNGDWDSADLFLRAHPFIFDFTSAEGRVTPDGKWIPKSEAASDYAKVAANLRVYYALNAKDRAAYVETHPMVGWFLKKYGAPGGLEAHSADYLKVKGLLAAYFSLDVNKREAFLQAHPELRAYFATYAQHHAMSRHAQDYQAVKDQLDAYFALPDSERSAYLAKHPDVQAYFDKYGRGHSGYSTSLRSALAENPEVASRYEFWQKLLSLPPDERAHFIHQHAEAAGIFIYGSLSYDDQQAKEARWAREAARTGSTARAVAYRHIKPLMDLYFSLDEGSAERTLFLEMNPELEYYFQHYSKTKTAIPTAIAPLVEHYFQLPAYGTARGDYLDENPELRTYFRKDSTPKEKAFQRQLDAFFKLPFGPHRDKYLAQHPELADYFDQRQRESDLFNSLAAAFNETDPRMEEFRAMYADIIPTDAMHLWALLRHRAKPIVDQPNAGRDGRRPPAVTDALATRRDRAV